MDHWISSFEYQNSVSAIKSDLEMGCLLARPSCRSCFDLDIEHKKQLIWGASTPTHARRPAKNIYYLYVKPASFPANTHTLPLGDQNTLRSKTKPAVAAWLAFFLVFLHVTKTRTRCVRSSRILKMHTHTRTPDIFFLANNK